MYLLSLLPLFVYICDVNSKCVKEEKREIESNIFFLSVLFHSFFPNCFDARFPFTSVVYYLTMPSNICLTNDKLYSKTI